MSKKDWSDMTEDEKLAEIEEGHRIAKLQDETCVPHDFVIVDGEDFRRCNKCGQERWL